MVGVKADPSCADCSAQRGRGAQASECSAYARLALGCCAVRRDGGEMASGGRTRVTHQMARPRGLSRHEFAKLDADVGTANVQSMLSSVILVKGPAAKIGNRLEYPWASHESSDAER